MCPTLHDGLLDSVLYVWLHGACVAHLEQGYVALGRCTGVCSQTVSMRGVSITSRLFFCSSPSGVRVHVCRLRGVPCGKLLRVVVRRKQCFVSTFESSPAVDLSSPEGALSDMQVVFFVVEARLVVTQISC